MGESYFSLFLNSVFSGAGPLAIMSLFFLFLGRILPIITQAPFFGAKVLPHTTKMALAVALFVIFLPKLLVIVKVAPTFDSRLLFLFMKELAIGYVLGFLITVPFNIIQIVGIVIDHQRGGASLMVNDPAIQSQSSPLGTFYNLVLIFIFFFIDGPFLFIEALVTSYEVIPPDQYFNPLLLEKGSFFWKMSMGLLNKVMVLSTQLASPALIAILMTDLFLGIANRLAPQVQVTFLGLPLKSLLGLLAVTLGWLLFTEQIAKDSLAWLQDMTELIYSFGVKAPAPT
jgi:type III secretion protein T